MFTGQSLFVYIAATWTIISADLIGTIMEDKVYVHTPIVYISYVRSLEYP